MSFNVNFINGFLFNQETSISAGDSRGNLLAAIQSNNISRLRKVSHLLLSFFKDSLHSYKHMLSIASATSVFSHDSFFFISRLIKIYLYLSFVSLQVAVVNEPRIEDPPPGEMNNILSIMSRNLQGRRIHIDPIYTSGPDGADDDEWSD